MNKAVYPGSFDPFTLGHLDIVERAAKMFDELVICVLNNKVKSPLFSVDERVKMISDATRHLGNVRVDSFEGLLIDYAKENNIHVSVRGLRAVTDFEYELQIGQTNRKLSNDSLDTVFLLTSLQYAYLSSSTVKEVASFGGSVKGMLPENIERLIIGKYERRKNNE